MRPLMGTRNSAGDGMSQIRAALQPEYPLPGTVARGSCWHRLLIRFFSADDRSAAGPEFHRTE